MSLEDLKLLYVFSCIALSVIILSPTLAMVIRLPSGEKFSELWLLGPGHMAEDYPFNVLPNQVYEMYLGATNHMGGLEYYMVYAKFRNQTEPLPDSINGTPSALEPLVEYRLFLDDNETWEREISFSFENASFQGNTSRVSRLIINGFTFEIDKAAMWDEENGGFYYQLFFELWLYNATCSCFQFHNRFVGIWLNMTETF
jgi:hypothetical protein